MKRSSKSGKKFRLLFYKHAMNRIWRSLLLFDLVLWVVWYFAPYVPAFFVVDQIIMQAALAVTLLLLISLMMRNAAYVQAREAYVMIKVPFYRLRIKYEETEALRPAELRVALQDAKLSGGDRRFLKAYPGNLTVMALILRQKIRRFGMRLFLPRYMFLGSEKPGFLLVVRDWMDFSAEFESRVGVARSGGVYVPPALREEGSAAPKKEPSEQPGGLYNLFDE